MISKLSNRILYTGDEYAGSGPRVSFEGSQETEVEVRNNACLNKMHIQ